MQHIRELRASPSYPANSTHCIYGQDADLIMLGLVTHEPHFCLLREVIDFNFNFSGQKTLKAVKKFTKESDFQLLHLSVLREYLWPQYAGLLHFICQKNEGPHIFQGWGSVHDDEAAATVSIDSQIAPKTRVAGSRAERVGQQAVRSNQGCQPLLKRSQALCTGPRNGVNWIGCDGHGCQGPLRKASKMLCMTLASLWWYGSGWATRRFSCQ